MKYARSLSSLNPRILQGFRRRRAPGTLRRIARAAWDALWRLVDVRGR